MRLQLHSLLIAKSHRLSSPLINYWVGSNLMRVYYESKYSIVKVNIQTIIINNSHATLVLVWPGHESWENSHANSRFSTLINSRATLVLVWPVHESWENSHANSRFSTLINSRATLVLVWPGYESWENSHANSRFSTLINSHATLVLVWPGHESLDSKHDLLTTKQQDIIFYWYIAWFVKERSNNTDIEYCIDILAIAWFVEKKATTLYIFLLRTKQHHNIIVFKHEDCVAIWLSSLQFS